MSEEEMTEYKDAFLTEAREHLASMNASLVALEKSPAKTEHLNEIFRASHTLKSMAAAMGYGKTSALCHAMEDMLDAIRHGKAQLTECADTLYECFDALGSLLEDISQGKERRDTVPLVQKLAALVSSEGAHEATGARETPSGTAEKVRTVGVKAEKLDMLMNLAEELLVNRMHLDTVSEELQNPALSGAVDRLGRLLTDLQYHVMQARMVPVAFLFNRFPRMVRDLAKQEGKEIELHTEGGEIELDRTVIDEMGQCLVHLVRNAVDHGIEKPPERTRARKPPRGRITLTAKRTRGLAVVEVADDGAGLDHEAIARAVERRAILSPDAPKEEVLDSIFSGVSTTKDVTALSGRGFGLNIVRGKVRSLGGDIKVESRPGGGTRFIMEVPLTLAIIRALFVGVGGATYGIPVTSVDRLIHVTPDQVKGFLNHESILLDGEDIPLTRLNLLFGAPRSMQEKQPVVIVRKGPERLAVAVHTLASTHEVVVKPVNTLLRDSRYFSGCTIIGSGEVALLLDAGSLILSGRRRFPNMNVGERRDILAPSGPRKGKWQ